MKSYVRNLYIFLGNEFSSLLLSRNVGHKGRFYGQKWIKTLLPVNDRNVHAMSLEICFWVREFSFDIRFEI